ncbi:hypothetical protein FGO68_gene12658 [Halteria grandinella]|uniref:Uncharacterized protein n=1 Tax=Halteria grandinella TaxID=5974 RepID=A0A8J8SWK9_HALGN|nr:hypothetical protein FGO68_gene12658 [Halteria grandinella]
MNFHDGCPYKELAVSKLILQELYIENERSDYYYAPIITDILKKCKDTLQAFSCNALIDLSPLNNSKTLKKLGIEICINEASLDTIKSFKNLQDLSTLDQLIVDQFKNRNSLKIFRFKESFIKTEIKALPESVKSVHFPQQNGMNAIQTFLEMNLQIKEVSTPIQYWHEAAYLLEMFKLIKFNFSCSQNLFSFSKDFAYLHQEISPATEPDHRLYELLFQRVPDQCNLAVTYALIAAEDGRDVDLLHYSQKCPQQMFGFVSSLEKLQSFLEVQFKQSHFEKVFSCHIAKDNDELLRIIVSKYDEVFQLGGNVEKTIAALKGMTKQEKEAMKRERYFQCCRENWQSSL